MSFSIYGSEKRILVLFFVFILLSFFSTSVLAATSALPSIGSMFVNFQTTSKVLTILVAAIAKTIGYFLVVASAYQFIQVANGRLEIKTPLTTLFVGAFLVVALTSFTAVSNTIDVAFVGPGEVFDVSSSMSSSTAINEQFAAVMAAIFTFMKLIGYVAFVRGALLLKAAGAGKDGMIGRGLTHIFGGALAINIPVTVKLIGNSLGVTVPW